MEMIHAKVIAHIIESKFNLFCCGCKIRDQDCLMLDEFEKWEMYGIDAMEEAKASCIVWREFSHVLEILNVPFEKYLTEHLLSLEENPDLMLIESIFHVYQDNQSLIEILRDLFIPKADPLERIAECFFTSPPTFNYFVRGKKERFKSKEPDTLKAYEDYLKDKLRKHFNNM